jgi:hypothetical protein
MSALSPFSLYDKEIDDLLLFLPINDESYEYQNYVIPFLIPNKYTKIRQWYIICS